MKKYITSLLGGAILPLAFAPFNLYSLAFISPAILCYLWTTSPTGKKTFLLGMLYGLGFFGVGMSWVYVSIHQFGNAQSWLAILITFLFASILSLFHATQGYLSKRYFSKLTETQQCLILFPLFWVMWELIRAHIFTGFPWLLLGYSQNTSPLHGLLPLIGIYGVSGCAAFIAGAIALCAKKNKPSTKLLGITCLALPLLIGWLTSHQSWTQASNRQYTVSLIQSNIGQAIKWDEKRFNQTLQTYLSLSTPHLSDDIIVWPEAAIPAFPSQIPAFTQQLSALGQAHDTTFIVGAPTIQAQNKNMYNSLLLYGLDHGQYNKRHLVPFGEFTPLQWLFSPLGRYLNIPMSDFSSGSNNQPTLRIKGMAIAPFICYEIAFPEAVLSHVKNKDLIVVINDDAWFGDSIALSQHLQIAQVQAIETGRYLLFASTTGITAIIGPDGTLTAITPPNQQAVLSGRIKPMYQNTPIMVWGYTPFYLFILIVFCLVCLLQYRHKKNKGTIS